MTTIRPTRAFTLVELIMVIVILGLLAAVAVPKFTDLRSQAQSAAEDGAVAAVRSGIQLYHMTAVASGTTTTRPSTAWPTTLDSATTGAASATNPLFTNVVDGGLIDKNWSKTGTRTYKYIQTASVYVYDQSAGTFTKQ